MTEDVVAKFNRTIRAMWSLVKVVGERVVALLPVTDRIAVLPTPAGLEPPESDQ